MGRLPRTILALAVTLPALVLNPAQAASAREPLPPLSGHPGRFVAPATSASSTTTAIAVSGTATGRRFDGVGAISTAGNSRYLIDYLEPARSDILDYLFKPGYGAALQVLKVEIGGDANSTDGAEASIEHTQGAVDCDAGYEFWLMQQARARNPAIQLYALAWTAPGWTGSFWSENDISYIVDWLKCAQRDGLRIDYLGGTQNERGYQKSWTESLRAALSSAGFSSTKLAMADAFDTGAAWSVAADLAGDAAFNAATAVVADHDICGYPTNGGRCTSTTTARNLGKPLWASELGAMDGNAGAASMARSMIRGYPTARLVSYITWPIASAMPSGLPHETYGLLYAQQPWSGNYRVNAMTYAIAMISWFTAPGWRYVNGANGAFGGAYANGSFTTLKAPDASAWSTIAETTTTTAAQTASFTISGGLPAAKVHIWRTKPSSTHAADWMVRLPDVSPVNRKFSYTLAPGYVYSFTTLARGPKGSAAPPGTRSLRAYVDQPGANPLDDSPIYLTAQDGAFQHRPCDTNPATTCTQQMTPRPPVYWRSRPGFPYAVIGDPSVQDYTVSCDVLFTRAGSSAGVIDRFSDRDSGISNFRGYMLALDDGGIWRLYKNSRSVGVSILASGRLPTPAGVGTWHNLALTIRGATLSADIDGRPVGSATDEDPNYVTGIAGIEAGATVANGAWTGTSWPLVQYRNLTIASAGSTFAARF